MIEFFLAYFLLLAFFLLDPLMRKGKRAKSIEKTESDNKSTALLVLTFFIVLVLSVFLNWLKLGIFNNEGISILGLVLMFAGLFIRIISILTLDKYYTRTLVTVDEQNIIKSGIYKYIRHPGYLGTILIWVAAGLAMQNLYVFIAATLLVLTAYYYRINKEEDMLMETFGGKYSEYKKQSWRLIPFVW